MSDKLFEEFREILRIKLTDEQFRRFASDWIDEDEVCRHIEDCFLTADIQQQKEWLNLIKSYLHLDKKGTIEIPIYFYKKGKKIVIDEELMNEEFENKLKEVVKNPEKFVK